MSFTNGKEKIQNMKSEVPSSPLHTGYAQTADTVT
jgi:hypothetical protein